MGYHISSWKTKKIGNLTIPLACFYRKNIPLYYRPQAPWINQTGDVVVKWNDTMKIIGRLDIDPERVKTIKEALSYVSAIGLIITNKELGVPIDLAMFEGNSLIVSEIKLKGESSGNIWNDVVKPALEHSTGLLEVVRIWETGDYVDVLTVVDGKLTEEALDL